MGKWQLKKIASSFLALSLTVTAALGVSSQKVYAEDKKETTQEVTVSRVVTGENGKSYIEVDGKPFILDYSWHSRETG